ncbi:unnamed protein product [Linum tenue]|uniref:Uncharacterized protein n=1 Tax=Linum tenue TaxID=586396 RepID=A0AAV0J159_9ROSI|nr:unnamed protein product [Linum tenue]
MGLGSWHVCVWLYFKPRLQQKMQRDQRIEKEKSDEKMRMMEEQIEQVNCNMPLVVEATLKRLGIQLPESSNILASLV